MKWIYHIPNGSIWGKNSTIGFQNVLLRPVKALSQHFFINLTL
jgi:hypothetical protein